MITEQRIAYPSRCLAVQVFNETRDRALDTARKCEGVKVLEPFLYLEGAECPDNTAAFEGATYKSLAYIAHRVGMSAEERTQWYNIARRAALSQAHVGCIIARLNERDSMIDGLEKMLQHT